MNGSQDSGEKEQCDLSLIEDAEKIAFNTSQDDDFKGRSIVAHQDQTSAPPARVVRAKKNLKKNTSEMTLKTTLTFSLSIADF